jgi:hypothetical protein
LVNKHAFKKGIMPELAPRPFSQMSKEENI